MNEQDLSHRDTPPDPNPDLDSPLTSSLHDATTAIDTLTRSLADFSHVGTPEPAAALGCCCGRDDCASLQTWLAFKTRLEGRLILSAGKLHGRVQGRADRVCGA